MMYLDAPPRLIGTEVFSAMPDAFRRKGARTDWADANRRGQPTDCFIEGPSFDDCERREATKQPSFLARKS
jgi:gluconolactonase